MKNTIDTLTEKNYKQFYTSLTDKIKFDTQFIRSYLPLITEVISDEESRHKKVYESLFSRLNSQDNSNLAYSVLKNSYINRK